MSTTLAFEAQIDALIIDTDVRRLVKRFAVDPRPHAEALLALHDALLELATVNDGIGLPATAVGYRMCAGLVSARAELRTLEAA
jgi:hypothetical protein